MKSDALSTIEKQLPHLSQDEQLWLIEHLAQHLRNPISRNGENLTLVAMANDPEIRAELRRIDEEFSIANGDGLEKV